MLKTNFLFVIIAVVGIVASWSASASPTEMPALSVKLVRYSNVGANETYRLQCLSDGYFCPVSLLKGNVKVAQGMVKRSDAEKWARAFSTSVRRTRVARQSTPIESWEISLDGKQVRSALTWQELSRNSASPALFACVSLEARLKANLKNGPSKKQ